MVALPLYSAYKPSGVSWLGEVPRHWETPRLKGYVTNTIDLTRIPTDGELYLALEHVESWTGRFSEVGNGVSISGQVKRFHAEDVLFGKLRPYLAKVVCPKRNGVCVGEFLVLRPHDAHLAPRYLEQLLRSRPAIDTISSSTFGAKMPRADWQFIGDLLFPLPPLPEQRAIVRYLDYVNRRIRRYVSAKRRLIELLEEEKQAIVNQAVTRGLDPDVRLKPSGVEWLGDVPEHWEVRRAKFFYREADERSSTGEEDLMSVSHITGVTPRKKTVTMFLAESNVGYKVCRPGDIVINTMWAYMAALGVARQNGLVSPSYGVYRPLDNEHFNYDYVDSLIRTEAYRANYLIRSTGITSSRLRLYPESFLDIPILCPPSAEQDAIVEGLGRATAAIDAAIARTRRQIELVQEYRTRLVADVVTGKVDVREAAASLPEEDDEEEPIDEDGVLADNMEDDTYDMGEPEEEPEGEVSI